MPVALDLAPLIALAAVFALILILSAYKATVGAVVDWLISNIPHISLTAFGHGIQDVFGFIRGPLEGFQNLVYRTLGALIAAQQAIWNRFVQWNAYAWQEVSGAVAGLAGDTEQALGYLRRHVIGGLIAGALAPLRATVAALQAAVSKLEAAGARVEHIVTHVTVQKIERVTTHVEKVTKGASLAAVATVAGTLPRLWHGIDQAEGAAEKALREARRLAARLTEAAAAGLVIAALARIGATWLRCSKVRQAGERVCGMDTDLLDALIADTALILGTVSIVEFAEGMQGVLGEIATPVRRFWRAA